MILVLLGPPGAGKGTQAQVLSQETGLAHVSSGDIFRENLKNKTELGKKAQIFVDSGELVPDDITIGMIRERLARPDCQKGVLLDGFPRTPAQAAALSQMLSEMNQQVNLVPYISVPAEVLIERLSGRWTCRAEGHVYHQQYNPPKQAGICDVDGSELYQREDDKPETVRRRIEVYLSQTSPLIEYYRKEGLLFEVDGTQAIDQVTEQLLAEVRKVK